MRVRSWKMRVGYRCLLIGALALHFAYLTKLTYVGLAIAPDCPVIGVMTDSGCCVSDIALTPVASHCGSSAEEDLANGQSGEQPTHAPKKSDDCPTCQKFAVFGKLVCVDLNPIQLVYCDRGSASIHEYLLPYPSIILDAEARGPPVSC